MDVDLIINCSALGSRELANDKSVYGLRGQVVKLAPLDIDYYIRTEDYYIEHNGIKVFTYIIPRSDGIIVGGYAEDLGLELSEPSREISMILVNFSFFFFSIIYHFFKLLCYRLKELLVFCHN